MGKEEEEEEVEMIRGNQCGEVNIPMIQQRIERLYHIAYCSRAVKIRLVVDRGRSDRDQP